jgi:hypothetical protein
LFYLTQFIVERPKISGGKETGDQPIAIAKLLELHGNQLFPDVEGCRRNAWKLSMHFLKTLC